MRTRSNVAIDLLGMAELQTTREVYLLPGGSTGTDRLSYPLRLIGTAHASLFTSLCRFMDIDEQSKAAVSMGAAPKLCSVHESRLEVNGSTGIAAVA